MSAISADRNTTTITTDLNGDGTTDKIETLVRQSDGTLSDTVKNYAPNGTLVSTAVTTTSATALSSTTQGDVDANGTVDQTNTSTTSLNNDGSRTTTTSVAGQGGTLRSKAATTISATGLSSTTQTDVDGNGSIDVMNASSIVLNTDGSRTTTSKETSGGATLESSAVTISANGFSTTTTNDVNGDGVVDTTNTNVTALNADGTSTDTVSDTNNDGSLRDQTVTTTSADRNTVTIASNINGIGTADNTETIARQTTGSVIDTDSAVNSTGKLIQKYVKTAAANGLSWTQTLDSNGDGKTDETQSDAIVYNADGSTTETYSDANANANIQPGSTGDTSKIVTTTSANDLNKTISVTGNNEGFNLLHTTTDNTVIGADGSTVETRTVSTTSGKKAVTVSKEVITTAAHGTSVTTQLDRDGTGTYNITDTRTLNADGSTTETYTDINDDGSLFEKDITTTSANGRNIGFQSDTDGDGSPDLFKTTVFNVDGSRTDMISTTTASGALVDKSIETTSTDGRTQTFQYDFDGDGLIDASETQVTVINSDGSTTETRSDYNANSTLRDRIVTTTSANGFSSTSTDDLNGDGTVDETTTNAVVLNKDGSKTATVRTTYSDGTLKNQTVTTTSADGLAVTTTQDLNGDGKTDVSQSVVTASSGVQTSTVSYYNASGTLLSKDVATISADGRLQSISRDFNGDGKQDVLEVEDHVADGNGSYDAAAEDYSATLYEGNHTIDENNVDQIGMLVNGKTAYYATETQQEEGENLGILNRLYDVMLDRDPTSAEQQGYLQYATFTALVTAVTTSAEFKAKYGTLTNSELVERFYQNADGRSATLAEVSSWLSQLKAGTATTTDLVGTISESAEHLTVGDVHAVTNNSLIVNGKFTLDHTTDKDAPRPTRSTTFILHRSIGMLMRQVPRRIVKVS